MRLETIREDMVVKDSELVRGYFLFEDKEGRILLPDEVDELSPWEVEALGIHVFAEGFGE